MAQLPPSPFLSAPVATPAADTAATNLCVERSVAAEAIPNSVTPPSPAVTDTAAADQVAPQVAAAEPFHSSCGSPSVEKSWPHGASPQQGAGTSSNPSTAASVSQGKGSDAAYVANPQTDPEDADSHQSPHEAIPSNEGRPEEVPAPRCTEQHEGAGALEDIDCINEIFFFARKLIKQAPRYLLDEGAFMADVEEEPLFLRDGDHLRRWSA